jgi:hypothetical protein
MRSGGLPLNLVLVVGFWPIRAAAGGAHHIGRQPLVTRLTPSRGLPSAPPAAGGRRRYDSATSDARGCRTVAGPAAEKTRAVERHSAGYRRAMECRIAGCNDLVKAKGLCNRHYLKLRRYGDPEASARRPLADPVSLERLADPARAAPCPSSGTTRSKNEPDGSCVPSDAEPGVSSRGAPSVGARVGSSVGSSGSDEHSEDSLSLGVR